MKPYPVKKMVEYCNHIDGKCKYFYEYASICHRLNRQVDENWKPHPVERPKWCTDETFVRVKIRPVVKNEKEYCWYDFVKCSLYHYGGSKDYCPVLGLNPEGDHTEHGKFCRPRPEACRKLEVE